jgi:hypothetical protein
MLKANSEPVLKFYVGMPIAWMSVENGTWQPVKAKGITVEAHLNSTHGMDALPERPQDGVTHGKS